MERVEASLPGAFELRPVVHRDSRGFFIETYHQDKLASLGIEDCFVQRQPLAFHPRNAARSSLPIASSPGKTLSGN